MEHSCAICLEDINKSTGQVVLSCEHTFHYRCIDNWFGKQVWEGLPQSCPCCRDAGKHHDRAEVVEVEDNEDEEEDYEDEGEEDAASVMTDFTEDIRWERVGPGRWFVLSNSTVAYESLRSLFGPMNELETEEDHIAAAASKIQALIRGHLVRAHRHPRV